MKKGFFVSLFLCLFNFTSANAGLIGLNGFSGNESVIDFNTFSAPAPGSFSHGGITFSQNTSNSNWNVLNLGSTNKALYNGGDPTDITLDFDSAFSRIGLLVAPLRGFGTAVEYQVSFFDSSLNLLGTHSVTTNIGVFVGWEDASGISRINILKGSPSGEVGGLDDIRFEGAVSAVPVPAAVWLFGSALMGLVGLRKKKA